MYTIDAIRSETDVAVIKLVLGDEFQVRQFGTWYEYLGQLDTPPDLVITGCYDDTDALEPLPCPQSNALTRLRCSPNTCVLVEPSLRTQESCASELMMSTRA